MGGSETGSTTVLAAIVASIGVLIVLPAMVVGVILMSGAAGAGIAGGGCGGDGGPGGGAQQIDNQHFNGEQMNNAQTITSVAVAQHLPKRAAVLAIATAQVESGLHNLPRGDRDSLGLFQQRPSQGWGDTEQILNPAYASGQFYQHLLAVPGWDTMPPGMAEQSVQRSAFPDRYAPHEHAAIELVGQFWTGRDNPPPVAPQEAGGAQAQQASQASGGCGDQGGSNVPLDPAQLPPGFALPPDPQQAAAVSYALGQLGKPYVWGAKGPDSFDCSGLMQAAWSHAGVPISAGTTHQAHDGTPVAGIAQAQPGDLLLIAGSLGSPSNPRHVGMYAGHGVVVNAYDENTGVIVESLDKWSGQIVAIRHIGGASPVNPSAEGDPQT